MHVKPSIVGLLISSVLLCGITSSASAAVPPPQWIYTNSLQNGWQNWSWAPVNFSNTKPVHASTDSISVTPGPNQALYLHNNPFPTDGFTKLSFWINGGSAGGQLLQVQATLNGTAQAAFALPALTAHEWVHVELTMAQLSVEGASNMDGFWIQDATGNGTAEFYVDGIELIAGPVPPPPPATVKVDAAAGRHAISPLIYGVAWPNPAGQVADLNATIDRAGGNEATSYNWQLNAQAKGNDWYFESWPSDSSSAPGEVIDSFIANDEASNADSMVTMPMIGWVATLGPDRSVIWSFSQAKYGAQKASDSSHPDAGNGVLASNGADVVNDPNDANEPSDATMENGWIKHLVTKWGHAAKGGVAYYNMDNEPSIWFGTHRDVHPVGATMDEIVDDIESYGAAIKSVDPSAQIAAPEEWGWTGYFWSGYDQQWATTNGWGGSLPDQTAHGGMYYVPYILQQLHDYQTTNHKRLLDVLSLHFYPQGGEYGNDESPSTELLRNRSTRQLWDTNYISESWIDANVDLIPLMQNWVKTYFPGTKTAITEYNWGDEGGMNGATTQADIYGIFGRENLDIATRWTVPATGTPTYLAMKMYRNYDGNNSTFGNTSVSDTVPNPDNLSSFAAIRSSDGALTVMVINKYLTGTTKLTLKLAHFSTVTAAQAWQLASGVLTQLPNAPIANSTIKADLPAMSVTLYVIPGG